MATMARDQKGFEFKTGSRGAGRLRWLFLASGGGVVQWA